MCTFQFQLTNVIQTTRLLVEYVSDEKLGPTESRRLSYSQRSDSFLTVPTSTAIVTVRPQRHSIGGGVLPQVMITSPSSPQKGSLERHRDDGSLEDNRMHQPEKVRKFSTAAAVTPGIGVSHYLGSDNFLSATRSHPTSPHQRRHSVTVPPRPNSFTNLSHNIVNLAFFQSRKIE